MATDQLLGTGPLATTIGSVSIEGGVNATGAIGVTFTTIDPVTGHVPDDPFFGFLPADDATGRGQGFFTFTVRPKVGLPTGTQIPNSALIFFDLNAPIATPVALNSI